MRSGFEGTKAVVSYNWDSNVGSNVGSDGIILDFHKWLYTGRLRVNVVLSFQYYFILKKKQLSDYFISRLDLDGVLVLVPDFINALDKILSEREPKIECDSIDKRELRKAAISILLSMVAFPYHYKDLPVPEFPGCNE